MRPRLILAFLLIAFASVAAADSIRFDPPVATGHTSVDAILSSFSTGCPPIQQGVTVTGTTVALRISTLPPPGYICAGFLLPFTSTFHLGVLPPGVYDVVEIFDTLTGPRPQARAKLIVRDDSLTAPPYAVPATGGEFIVLRMSDTTGRVVVIVDGQAATFVRNEAAGNVYLAPPHTPGTVDVTVASASTYRTAVAALTYFDRKAPPDPALFELILFPTSFEGPGVFGARWTAENYIAAGENEPVRFRDALPCFSCTDLLTAATPLRNDQNPAGLALYALRGTASQLMTGSRIRDVSRPAQNGTEVPVVRDSDFRDRGMYFLTVPVDRHSRVTLRAWALTDTPMTISGLTPPVPLRFVPVSGTSLAFATLDLTSYFQQLPQGAISAYIYFPRPPGFDPRMWGLISVTNNETQQVTIVSSQ
jgi:hypothetical protein